MSTLEVPQLSDDQLAFIDGDFVAPSSGDYLEDVDPATGRIFARVASCGREDADAATASARAGFESWRRTAVQERADVLHRIATSLREGSEDLARLEAVDVGKPLTQARSDVQLAARYFEYYAGVADKIHGESIPVDWDSFGVTFREPLGVTVHISPWNYPLLVAARSIAPALAAGNSCVLKPAEEAPLTPLQLARIGSEAGLPPGALNVVPGIGGVVGAALAGASGVDHISFTGSPQVGTLIMQMAAENWNPVSLELGGKSPNILFADADLAAALPMVRRTLIQNSGQTCSAATRLLVHSSIHERVVEQLQGSLSEVSIGPALDDPDMGPLISATQLERVLGYVRRARDEGAEVVVGGSRPAGASLQEGYYVEPTLIGAVESEMEIAREEVFGPVLAVLPFDDLSGAVELANATPYGLAAGVWTRDVNEALSAVRRLECGQVYVNTYALAQDVSLPFGGYKKSGFGREKGVEAVLEYTQVKAAAFRIYADADSSA